MLTGPNATAPPRQVNSKLKLSGLIPMARGVPENPAEQIQTREEQMRFRPNVFRKYTERPTRPGVDQLAWDWFAEQHNTQPTEMFYRRTDGYAGSYTALVEVIGNMALKFRTPRKALPRNQPPAPVQGSRRTRVTIYERPPKDPQLRELWTHVTKSVGTPQSLRLERTARGPKRVTVILDNKQEVRFSFEEQEQTWVLGV